jgi:hypothetical protein
MLGLESLLMEQLLLFRHYLGIIVLGAAEKVLMVPVMMAGFSLKFAKIILMMKHTSMRFIKKHAKSPHIYA